MSDWYTKTGNPSNRATGSSAAIRAEFALIETALNKLPTLTGNGLKPVRVNSGGTALEAVSLTTFAASVLSEAVALTGTITPSQITSNQNDYNPTGLSTASVLRLNSDASRNITGLQGGSTGRLVSLHNIGSFNVVLKDADTGSSAANRFALDMDITIRPDMVVLLQYDATSSRWRAVGQWASAFIQTLLPAADAAAARTTLGAAASGANTDITTLYLDNIGLKIKDTNATHGLSIVPGSNLTADRALSIVTGDADRTLTLSGNLQVEEAVQIGAAATQSDMEAASSTTKFVTPARQHFSKSAFKALALVSFAGAAPWAFNIAAIDDDGPGFFTAHWTDDFSDALYPCGGTAHYDALGTAASTFTVQVNDASRLAGEAGFHCLRMSDFAGTDANYVAIWAGGDQ